MITTLKLAGMSAVLSAGLVSGFDADAARPANPSAKIYMDRLPEGGAAGRMVLAYADASQPALVSNSAAKGDRLRWVPEAGNTDGRVAATVTFETHTGAAASALARVPAATASR